MIDCNPGSRVFPATWKNAYWRCVGAVSNGYRCPICNKIFSGNKGFKKLEADHIFPYVLDNQGTTWNNMILLCKKCNLKKWKFNNCKFS
ncbi:HNH endonuclease [Desulfonatronum thioautotrophicum]|uniref:HNH endonuclease n=1 Tax=Desulfonatronum thioautotrophicum TaxID=617001 RepID=UPI00137926BD